MVIMSVRYKIPPGGAIELVDGHLYALIGGQAFVAEAVWLILAWSEKNAQEKSRSVRSGFLLARLVVLLASVIFTKIPPSGFPEI